MVNGQKFSVTGKLGDMRKAVEWTVYPQAKDGSDESRIILQSHARIVAIDTAKGKGLLSKACPSGAYFVHLHPAAGAKVVDVPADMIEAAKAAQPKSGDEIGPGVRVL